MEQVKGTVKIGFDQINNPTPMWVTWIFRTEFVLNKAFMFWIASTTLINMSDLKETILIATCIDSIVWGLGKFVGITKAEIEK